MYFVLWVAQTITSTKRNVIKILKDLFRSHSIKFEVYGENLLRNNKTLNSSEIIIFLFDVTKFNYLIAYLKQLWQVTI